MRYFVLFYSTPIVHLRCWYTVVLVVKSYIECDFSSVRWPIGLEERRGEGGGGGGLRDDFSRDPLPVSSAGGHCEQFWLRQECPLFDVVHPAFLQPTTASPTLQGVLKDGFGEAVVACDVPDPCKFLYLDFCQKRFLWTQKRELIFQSTQLLILCSK